MKYIAALFASFFFVISAFCQKQQLFDATNKHENMRYYDSQEIYKNLLKRGFRTAEVYQNLGDSYYFNGDYRNAAQYYKSLFGLKKPVAAEYYFRNMQSLKAQNKYDLADKFLNEIPEEIKLDSRFKLYFENQNYLNQIKSLPKQFNVDTTSINSHYSDYGASISGNKFYFTSSRDTSGIFKRTHSWTNQAFFKMYQADISADGILINPEAVKTNFSKNLNQSSSIFTKDRKTMYFTQNNSKEGKRVKNESDKTLLKIFKATFDGKKWKDAIALPFNSDDYSCAHPTLSVDEKYLYFSSDMPGTVGASDIFRVEIFENETYGKPENLGSKINTEGRETFPFISQDDILYFATDGRPGLGGLDIYKSNLNATGEVITVENLGPEINSNFDDFAFFINAENSRGYFSSNRSKGLGLDDIYKFTKVKKCEMIYKGQITESQNLQPLESVSVSMLNDQGVLIAQEFTDSNGNFSFKIECDESYFLSLKKDFYHSSELLLNALEKTDLPKSITMETVIKPIKVGDNLAKILSIENIYFDLDKYDIRADAAYELSKILLILKQESTMKISIRSHTDSRASSEYNHELSSNRANATMMWLIKNGIDAARLTATGYGETQLVNNCSDGVECTDEEHQQNRRSDFIVLQL